MSHSDAEIINAIEDSMFMYKGIKDQVEVFHHKYMKGYFCKNLNTEEFNKVGLANIPDEEVDQTIREIISFYKSIKKSRIRWSITSKTNPKDLGDHLLRHGFKKEYPVWGMVRSIKDDLNIKENNNFEIREIDTDVLDVKGILRMVEKAYGLRRGAGRVVKKMMMSMEDLTRHIYIAYDNKKNKPVAFASLVYVPDTKIALFASAATLPKYRNQGIYSQMLKTRYEQAKSDGIQNLIIQAHETTSAPIASKYGFTKISEIQRFLKK